MKFNNTEDYVAHTKDKETEPSKATVIPKGWGGEYFAYHTPQEHNGQKLDVDTVKLMYFEKDKKCSIHYHKLKEEYFICVVGRFRIELTDEWGSPNVFELEPFQRVFIPKMREHRIIGLEDKNILLEVSSLDHPDDSIRLVKGD